MAERWPIVGRWSYTGDPNDSNRDKVRWLIGDTNSDDPLVSDEEVNEALADRNSAVYLAAADCCLAIAARFARLVTRVPAVGGTGGGINLSDLHKHYLELGKKLEQRGTTSSITGIYAGGISQDDKDSTDDDDDRVKPFAQKGQFDNPEASWPDTTNPWEDSL